ncbi:MAG TPA: hypothetical protein V6D18_17585 [Thermosynechococcaceae cyanobacterium]
MTDYCALNCILCRRLDDLLQGFQLRDRLGHSAIAQLVGTASPTNF